MIGVLYLALLVFAKLPAAAALDSAVASSPDVATANARVDEASAALSMARGALVPSIVGSYAQTPQGNPPGPNVTSRIANLGLQTNVADFIAYGPSVRRSTLDLESARDDALVAIRIERVKAATLYFDALKARAVVEARARAFDLATAQRAAARTRFAAGDGPRLDVVRADLGIAKASTDLEAARDAKDDALAALALETGTSVDELDATADDASVVASVDPDPDPAKAIERASIERAEIASAVAAQNAETAARAAAAASAFPSLTVGAGYAEGTDSGVPVRAPTLAVALTLPIGSSEGSRVRAEDSKIAAARARVVSARRSVALEVGSAARAVLALGRAADASSRAREAAERELAATDLGYRSGASSSLDVRAAQTAYAQASVDESTARYDLAKARVILTIESGR